MGDAWLGSSIEDSAVKPDLVIPAPSCRFGPLSTWDPNLIRPPSEEPRRDPASRQGSPGHRGQSRHRSGNRSDARERRSARRHRVPQRGEPGRRRRPRAGVRRQGPRRARGDGGRHCCPLRPPRHPRRRTPAWAPTGRSSSSRREDLEEMIDVNVKGALYAVRAALPDLLKSDGRRHRDDRQRGGPPRPAVRGRLLRVQVRAGRPRRARSTTSCASKASAARTCARAAWPPTSRWATVARRRCRSWPG